MTQYSVTGMSCAACQARVEKAVLSVPGVDTCAVSLLTNSMGIEGNADPGTVIKAVVDAGYGAALKDGGSSDKSSMKNYEEELKDTETPGIRKRLIASICLLLPLMYVSMGHMLMSFPLPSFMDGNHIAMGLYELLLAASIMVINQRFFISGSKALFHKAPNMDTLVALGSAVSFAYSIYALFAMTVAEAAGDSDRVMALMDEFYFESAAMILTLITVGKLLESISKGRTTNALKELMKLAPKTAVILEDGREKEISVDELRIGDRFVLKPGSSIPVDGVVVDGNSAVNESALTGESIPVEKNPGDAVSAATINESGYLICEAKRVGNDTTLSQIIRMVSDAAATKAPIAKIADKVSGIFVPVVIAIATITFIAWMIAGQSVAFALARAISVLVISCPCALGLATPVAVMVGNGVGAKQGIMFKTAASLEATGKVGIIALDKTGTVTEGKPGVKGVYPAQGVDEKELLSLAYSLEVKSEHPLAKAVTEHCSDIGVTASETERFTALPGAGITAVTDGMEAMAGSREMICKNAKVDKSFLDLSDELACRGETPLFFSKGGKFAGMISVADVIKEDSKEAVAALKRMGLDVVMITGDNEKTASAIAGEAGIDEFVAGVKPDGKAEVIKALQKKGKVAMVGDGINDAPALTVADMGIAIGAGNDVAIDAADVVLVKSRLSDVAAAVRLSRETLRNIHQNLFWAFAYNLIGIPLAAGVFIPILGWTLNPMFGAAAMSVSSFFVVSNALRLNLFDVHDGSKDRVIKNKSNDNTNNIKEDKKEMELTVKGMMCAHCEAHVKEALEKIDGVTNVIADHEKNLVTLSANAAIDESILKAAVEGAGYEFAGIR